MAVPQIVKTPDSCVFFALFGAQKPYSGVKIFPEARLSWDFDLEKPASQVANTTTLLLNRRQVPRHMTQRHLRFIAGSIQDVIGLTSPEDESLAETCGLLFHNSEGDVAAYSGSVCTHSYACILEYSGVFCTQTRRMCRSLSRQLRGVESCLPNLVEPVQDGRTHHAFDSAQYQGGHVHSMQTGGPFFVRAGEAGVLGPLGDAVLLAGELVHHHSHFVTSCVPIAFARATGSPAYLMVVGDSATSTTSPIRVFVCPPNQS